MSLARKQRKSKKDKITRSVTAELSKAKELLDRGEYGSAHEKLATLVGKAPELAQAWHLFGAVNYLMGDIGLADTAFEKAVSLDPANIEYQNDLAGTYLSRQRFAEAETLFQNVVRLAPDYLEAKYNLATCLLEQSKYESAIPMLETVCIASPQMFEAIFNLGLAYKNLGKHHKALSWLVRAAKLRSQDNSVVIEMARCHLALESYDLALEQYEKLGKRATDARLAVEIAEVMYRAGQGEKALSFIGEAITYNSSDDSDLRTLQSDIALNLGDIALAQQSLMPILRKPSSQHFPGAANLAVRIGMTRDYDLINKLNERLDSVTDPEHEVAMRFALGKAYDDDKEYDRAWREFDKANSIRASQVRYDRALLEDTVKQMVEIFSDNAQLLSDANGTTSERASFVVGMPRSGTSLVEQILATHSEIHGAGELGYFSNITHNMGELFGLNIEYPRALSSKNVELLEKIKQPYQQLLQRHNATATYVIDKFPENFLHLGLIKMIFPAATIFHVTRDPGDIALSIYFQNFERGNAYSWRLEDIAHYYVQYELVMKLWHSLSMSGLESVCYETLIENPEGESRRLIRALGLPWEETCLEFHASNSDVRTASNWQVRQPIYHNAISRSKNYPEMLRRFNLELENQRSKFGLTT